MKRNTIIRTVAIGIFAAASGISSVAAEDGRIADQSFEVTLSEYSGKVWFVSYPPSDSMDVTLKIMQDGLTLETLDTYTPQVLDAYSFTSLDAVSFVDYNEDGNTDILVIKTFGDVTVPVIYEGTPDREQKFTLKSGLSIRAMQQAEEMTIAGVQAYLSSAGEEIGESVSMLPDGIPANFVFSSGAGAWGTSLSLNQDGSFSGSYSDTDMTGGDGYVATQYYSNFSGCFDNFRKLSDHVYSMHVSWLQLSEEPGTQEIRDDCLNVATAPYGVKENEEYYLYLPGTDTTEMPAVPQQGWTGVEYTGTQLTGWVLYNPADDTPFGGFD